MQKVTIITGGSRGIGKATALCLAQQGHHVCIGYRSREDEADEVVDILRGFGQSAMAVQVIDYAASKGAVDTLTIGLAQEVAAQGIRVNAVRPGFIYTGMYADGGEPDRIERIKDSLPMKRGGQPEEVAQAIAWLLSDEASYVTGNFIDLAGGK
ncbi:SDR family oxidoreductase [Xenorhabdus sp. XENO-1]|uniref:SDR family oxidoreductase n=1 Tax=Xenorhabdus bovienii TaxID=40576 RepID=UPI0020CA55BD|nr:SDR family oxidoreductase [Xenorhabdus bovienii]MCP9268946.1 SDR family oxidoreductase [Xenorhabdus bovienii subsp. africana]